MYQKLRQPNLALQDLNLAVQESVDLEVALTHRGKFYTTEQRYDEALKDLYEVLKKKPLYTAALKLIAFICYTQEDYKTALEKLNLILAQTPSDEDSLAMRVQARCKLGDYEAALRDTNRLIRLNQSTPIIAIQIKLTNRLTLDYQATNNQHTYTSRKRSGSVIQGIHLSLGKTLSMPPME